MAQLLNSPACSVGIECWDKIKGYGPDGNKNHKNNRIPYSHNEKKILLPLGWQHPFAWVQGGIDLHGRKEERKGSYCLHSLEPRVSMREIVSQTKAQNLVREIKVQARLWCVSSVLSLSGTAHLPTPHLLITSTLPSFQPHSSPWASPPHFVKCIMANDLVRQAFWRAGVVFYWKRALSLSVYTVQFSTILILCAVLSSSPSIWGLLIAAVLPTHLPSSTIPPLCILFLSPTPPLFGTSVEMRILIFSCVSMLDRVFLGWFLWGWLI